MGYDDTCFAAALINLAVKGYLKITQKSDKEYLLEKTGKEVDMASGEKELINKLMGGHSTATIKQSNYSAVMEAQSAHKSSLKIDYEKKYFLNNSK